MTPEHVALWTQDHPLSAAHVDCATAVMLKILDGKCKMSTDEKIVMTLLYDAVKQRPGLRLASDIHHLIAMARTRLDDAMREFIYEKRILAETTISRPVMKEFEALIRQTGLFESPSVSQEEEGSA